MSTTNTYQVSSSFKQQANLKLSQYQTWYKQSISEPEIFWSIKAKEFLQWISPWEKVYDEDFKHGGDAWFVSGKLNACVNCVDRHLKDKANQVAILWEGDELNEERQLTYRDLYHSICRLANVMKQSGIRKGDRVCIYLPMIPEAVIAMLACARIGAIHSVVFGGFSPQSLQQRILDSDCRMVITADGGLRGGKLIPLKANTDQALKNCPHVHHVIVIKEAGCKIKWHATRDIDYHDAVAHAEAECIPATLDAEDPLFILYTSGSTGKPKGVLHGIGGYLLQAAMTHKYILDYHPGDIYWCSADVGWVTGHSYIVYGPLANGATTLMFAGVPTYPNASRWWQIIDKYQVNIFYTAPTAIRALMAIGDGPVKQSQRNSLRLLGTVGEPINPEAWRWYYEVVGNGRCPIVDTWWQTETGAMMITPIPGAFDLKPGVAMKPFFGVQPALLDEQGKEITGPGTGQLVIKQSWPGQIRTVFRDHQRCFDTYFKPSPGYFTTGDGAERDAEGDYRITGRTDDILNVSGHRLGTAEIESALVAHPSVAEAAVVGMPHDIKGQAIFAFITTMHDINPNDSLRQELIHWVADAIGPIAKPDQLQWAPGLPKTRSGKIMRRILRKIAANDFETLGDTSTLADPLVVNQLIATRKTK